jgi:hypothetical protein
MAKTIGQLTQATTLASADEFIIEQSGLTKRVAASVVRGGLIDADIDAAADIAGSKLADDAITTAKIDDDAVTTAKILDANVTPAKLSQPLTLETAQATTSGTSIDFTGIPSWVKRITVMLNGVSTNSTSLVLLRVGAGSVANSGYVSGYALMSNAASNVAARITTAFYTSGNATAGDARYGHVVLTNISGNTWVASGVVGTTDADNVTISHGGVALSGTLDRLRLTTANGTDTFDAGSVNIMYEG